jgi:hypothetical protein
VRPNGKSGRLLGNGMAHFQVIYLRANWHEGTAESYSCSLYSFASHVSLTYSSHNRTIKWLLHRRSRELAPTDKERTHTYGLHIVTHLGVCDY